MAHGAVAGQAFKVLKQHCFGCHGTRFEVPGFNILDRDILLKPNADEIAYVVPGNVEDSYLWERMALDRDMPPETVKRRPSEEEMGIIKAWIESGAEFPRSYAREFISEEQVLSRILRHLSSVPPSTVKHQRYFTLVNIHNNPAYSEEDLRLYRAAFVKLVNSLSRNTRPINPILIDAPPDAPTEGVIFNIDLRRVGWLTSAWQQCIKPYPYGMQWNDPGLRDLGNAIHQQTDPLVNDGVPYIRADWFIAQASRPPAYHNLLYLPKTIAELEKQLEIDVERDFHEDLLKRAGFAGSGVAYHNRLVDRHEGPGTAYYYRSYDFAESHGRALIFQYPLGPKFESNPFNEHAAFEHNGGEVIWSLPNGMQAYILIDAEGNRIDEAPVEIVRDLNETANTPAVVNGISCMNCHREGMIPYKDSIRLSFPLSGEARSKVTRLYTPRDEMDELVLEDRGRFLHALESLLGRYLQVGEESERRIEDFPEPISQVVRWYHKDIGRPEAAYELGLRDPEAEFVIRGNQKLQELGLGPFAEGNAVPRAMWDTLEESPQSIYQRAAFALGLGNGARAN